MDFDDEKVTIITGASRGIGTGLIEVYRKHGYRVIVNSRSITDSPHPEVLIAAVTKSLAIEYAGHGIRFNAISPGVIDTPLHAGVGASASYAGLHPQNRIGVVDDIVHGALYLETVPFVTGEILHVDGGQSAGH
jgi:NAD(P)-dependent dehydrogenase (short-subunit alcohol dehydrogenase family)